ncbi:MAG: transposase [Blastocatellia bacterium]
MESEHFTHDHTPLAYLITFRSYGTWLHGDERDSTDRHHNVFDTPFIPQNDRWRRHSERSLRHSPVELDSARRGAVETGIRETSGIREWRLFAMNVRTNHVHIVVHAVVRPELMLAAFKANATRKMRESKRRRRNKFTD